MPRNIWESTRLKDRAYKKVFHRISIGNATVHELSLKKHKSIPDGPGNKVHFHIERRFFILTSPLMGDPVLIAYRIHSAIVYTQPDILQILAMIPIFFWLSTESLYRKKNLDSPRYFFRPNDCVTIRFFHIAGKLGNKRIGTGTGRM
jgi:hypothetical protein